VSYLLFVKSIRNFRFSQIKSLMPSGAGCSRAGGAAARGSAQRYHPEDVQEELRRLLLKEMERRGDFSKVQAYPTSFGEVVDESEAKPVILSPAHSHRIVM
jgi:hypothetical protein